MLVEWASISNKIPISNHLIEPGHDMWYYQKYQMIWWTQILYLHPGALVSPASLCQPLFHLMTKETWDHSELGSVKVSRSLPSVRTRLHRTLLGAVGNLSKCRRASTLRILNERKFQFCFHLTHWDSQGSFFATAIWNAINLHNNKVVEASFSSMTARRYFVRSLFCLSQELAAPADLEPCSGTSSSATPCSGNKVLRKVVDWKVEY